MAVHQYRIAPSADTDTDTDAGDLADRLNDGFRRDAVVEVHGEEFGNDLAHRRATGTQCFQVRVCWLQRADDTVIAQGQDEPTGRWLSIDCGEAVLTVVA